MNRPIRYLCLALAVGGLIPATLSADQNWDGDNGVGNFSFNNNWFGNSQPSWGFGNGNLNFQFNNANATSVYFDYGGWRDTNDIYLLGSWTGSFTWSGDGNGLNFKQRLENQDSATLTIGSMKFSGGKNGASQIELNPVNGDITFSSTSAMFNDFSNHYAVYGNNGKTLTVNITLGTNSNNGSVGFSINQNSTVIFGAAQTYSQFTDVNAGRLELNANGSIASNLSLGATSGSAAAEFRLTDGDGGFSENANITVRSGSSGTKTISSTNTSGTNTLSGSVTLNADATVSTSSGGKLSFTGAIGGGSNLNMAGSGTVVLTNANTFTGTTTVSGGTLEAAAVGALTTTSAITINSGGTLLLSGTGDRISDTVPFTLAGGTLNGNGLSESFGALTLTANSTIDFASGAGMLTFANSSASSWGSFRLSIWNWSGTTLTGGGIDQLRFASNGLTTAQLGQIDFFSDSGVSKISITPSFPANAFVGGAGEVAPVPEASSALAAMALLGLVGVAKRRKG